MSRYKRGFVLVIIGMVGVAFPLSGLTKKDRNEKREHLRELTGEFQHLMMINPIELNERGIFARNQEENRQLAQRLEELACQLQEEGFDLNMVHVQRKIDEFDEKSGTAAAIARGYAAQAVQWKSAHKRVTNDIAALKGAYQETADRLRTMQGQLDMSKKMVEEKETILTEVQQKEQEQEEMVQKQKRMAQELQLTIASLQKEIEQVRSEAQQKLDEHKMKESKDAGKKEASKEQVSTKEMPEDTSKKESAEPVSKEGTAEQEEHAEQPAQEEHHEAEKEKSASEVAASRFIPDWHVQETVRA